MGVWRGMALKDQRETLCGSPERRGIWDRSGMEQRDSLGRVRHTKVRSLTLHPTAHHVNVRA